MSSTTSFTATFKKDEKNEESKSVFDKDQKLKDLINEYKSLEKDLEYIEHRLNSRIQNYFPKGQTVYIEATIENYDIYERGNPLTAKTKEGTRLYIKPDDIINKEVFDSPLGDLMYGKTSKRQDSSDNEKQ